MQHGQFDIKPLEPAAEAFHKLRGQGDFRDQDQCLALLLQGFCDRPQIDLGFAAAGHAVQEKRRELSLPQGLADL